MYATRMVPQPPRCPCICEFRTSRTRLNVAFVRAGLPSIYRGNGEAHTESYFSVAYMMALMECMRFSASSNTRLRSLSKTSSVTSSSGMPNFS